MPCKAAKPLELALAAAFAVAGVLCLCTAAAAAGQDDAAPKPEELKTLVEDAAKDLKSIRKVTLKVMPPVQVVSRERYIEEYVLPTIDFTWGGDFEKSLEIFKALGMIPADLKGKPFLRRYGAALTAASYDFLGKRILFPGAAGSRDTLLHELVHAAQDQDHDIRKMMLAAGPDFDRMLAMGALFEGEALNVQLRYTMGTSRVFAGVTPYGTLREEARAKSDDMRRRVIAWMPDVPPNIIRAQGFVYDEGVLFVERLRRRAHNWKAVDDAYKMPPRSTTQILHPEKYLAGEWPITLEVEHAEKFFPPDYALVAENTLGEFGMRLFLMTHGSDADAAATAVEGWRGDRVLLYRSGAKKADVIIWVSMWESPARAAAAAKTFEKAFGRAMTRARGTDVTLIVGGDFPAMPDFRVIRKLSAEGRPLGDQEEREK